MLIFQDNRYLANTWADGKVGPIQGNVPVSRLLQAGGGG
jgi:hypothetical protein